MASTSIENELFGDSILVAVVQIVAKIVVWEDLRKFEGSSNIMTKVTWAKDQIASCIVLRLLE
jgi:hypothetical protein